MGDFIVLDFTSDDEGGESEFDYDAEALLSALVGVRGTARVRMELLHRFRGDTAPTIPVPARRTVADLLDNAARRRADHDRRLAAQRAEVVGVGLAPLGRFVQPQLRR
ncbi:hypothetical protein OG558_40000 [Kribbella sp. NBC_01510]|uniref:hypothetical protein n=1 Tax=Kribbella sp. NBC_01510 TaxID=2903581 RepID=UPI00386A5C91